MTKENLDLKTYFIPSLIAFSFLARLATVYFYRDMDLYSVNVNEWLILLQNLIKYKSYSYYVFDNQAIPSVYMPPVYLFFLYLIKIISSFEGNSLLNTIIFVQIILSTYSVYLFYQINQNFFSNKISLINSIIFSIIPLNVYACGQISSINLQIVLSLLFLKYLLLLVDKEEIKNLIFFSVASGLLILTRGEFVLIFIIIFLFGAISKKIKLYSLIKIILIIFLIISPYVIRNYIHFNQVMLVKSFGFNLWKGNNELSRVQGFENFDISFKKLESKINNLEKNKYYELNRDDIFLNEAKKNLIENPLRYFNLYLKKIFSFYFIDFNSTYPNYYNYFNIFPALIFGILSFPGLFIFFGKKNVKYNYITLYLLLNLLIFSIFFILPRYKLIILPIQIIIASNFVCYFLGKMGKKDKKNNIN